MFAKLIGRQLERDQLLQALQKENRTYSQYALTDPLTGIPNRRALQAELSRALANDHDVSRQAITHRLERLTRGVFDIGSFQLNYEGASVGIVTSSPEEKDFDAFVQRADEAMYSVKKARCGV